ncbi:MAG TPA: AsmA family protein [Terriglobales bacterium]|nr:AsmA family protein [Terriglobales bacterium]
MKTALKVIGIVIAVLIGAAIALPFLVNVNSFRPQIESKLSSALGRPVKVGNLSLGILSGSVGADRLSIADDPKFSQAPFIQAKSLKVGVELMPLIFSKQLNVTHIVIDQPEIMLLRNPAGVWNFSSLGGGNEAAKNQPAAPSAPAASPAAKSPGARGNLNVAKLALTDGKLSFGTLPAKRQPLVYDKVELTMRDFSFASVFPVTASAGLPGGGSLKLDGTAGPINAADTSLTPLQAKLNIKKLDLSQSALVDPTLGITGSADFDGSVSSDGHLAKTNGTIKATALKLVPKGSPAAQPIQLVYTLEHHLQSESGKLLQGDVSVGKALARLTGTYDMKGETTSIRTRLNGQALPVDDLEAALPAVGVVLPSGSRLKGGTLSVDLESVGPVDRLITAGPVKLSNAQLSGFNLGSKLSAISALSGKQTGNDTNIQNLSSDVRVAPEGTRLDKISLVVPAIGELTGTGTISPSGALAFKMSANLSGGAVTGLTQMAGLGGKGTGAIPFAIQGTTSNPSFVPDLKGMAGSQLKGLLQGNDKNNPLGGLTGLFGKKKPPPK